MSERSGNVFGDVMHCMLCPDLGREHVPSIGSLSSDLMIIGASPGAEEVKKREPFVGPSGQLVDGMLAEIPLGREDIYIANALKCHPPGNRAGDPWELKNCWNEWLKHEVAELQPKVILLLGKDAWTLVPTKWHPKKGKIMRIKKGPSFIFWYHPAFYIRRADVQGFLQVAALVKKELEQ